jgi:hypothetical protein
MRFKLNKNDTTIEEHSKDIEAVFNMPSVEVYRIIMQALSDSKCIAGLDYNLQSSYVFVPDMEKS